MLEIRLNKYVDLERNYANYGEDGYYINPFIMENMIIESLDLDMSFNQIRDFVTNANVSLTEEEIKQYLSKKMDEEQPGLREKLEKARSQTSGLITLTADEEEIKRKIKASTEKLGYELEASKYEFEPYTLKYFKNYIDILKVKCLSLFEIYDGLYKISRKRNEISEETLLKLKELDFHFNEYGYTYYEDILRLANTIIYNVNDLYEKVKRANNIDTYLTFSVSLHSLYKDGILESELYPIKEVQIKDLHYSHRNEFIPLTEYQKSILRQERREILEKMIKDDFGKDISPESRTQTNNGPVLQKKI